MNMKLVDAVLACHEAGFECVALPLGDFVDPRVIVAVRENRDPVDHFVFTAEPRLRISEAKAFHENLARAKRDREVSAPPAPASVCSAPSPPCSGSRRVIAKLLNRAVRVIAAGKLLFDDSGCQSPVSRICGGGGVSCA
ncbi:hypothetical protein SAMN05216338_1001841 [Bradyrhizobium sp. Rc2d]|uniref:hypothetical protein n=1 Tax=Bradyrhizobium sp. Rc2d TaxID=1855321 RepID=UPI000890F836|nr:hypothetical protein [Bradyrhizobium sp. Rc2d]SDG59306.1 hypothetical protein SAMN05216338_1001841 [Bradyrhizobium sp. Rc2d]